MDELRLPSQSLPARRAPRTPERSHRLGLTLREAREEKGLELRDLSEITNVRPAYLEALEAGHYGALPEEVYSKNFVRLYAQAVGLDPARMLLLYAQERRSVSPPAARETGRGSPEPAAPLSDDTSFNPLDNPWFRRVWGLLLPLLLVIGTVALALWTFNGLLSPAPHPVETEPADTAQVVSEQTVPPQSKLGAAPATTAALSMTTAAPARPTGTMILLSLRTTPPGAEVSVDGYHFGQSPIVDAPVRSGQRTVRIERGGYRTFERTLDLRRDRHLNVALTPSGVPGATPVTPDTFTPTRTPPAEASSVTLTVTAEAWLEVYQSSAKGEGERLVFETAQPGDTFTFEAPVYVFSGNAGGVLVTQDDEAARALGPSGAVVGAAY